jgi:DNA polymerase-3 subunit chi
MTEVNFHTGLADPLAYACRLLRKSQKTAARVVVTGECALLDRLDVMLWTFEPFEFLPHVRLRHGDGVPARMADTPIWLADDPLAAPNPGVLVNLGPELSAGFESFGRLFELVGQAPDQRDAGRRRWQHFKARGYPVTHQEVQA